MGRINQLWWLALAACALCVVAFWQIEALQVCRLLRIQFSSCYAVFYKITQGYSEEVLRANHCFDFVFIACYTLLFVYSSMLVAQALEFKFNYKWLLPCLLPGLFDMLENLAFLECIGGKCPAFFKYYWAFVRLKWAAIIPFAEMVLAILGYQLFYHFSRLIKYLWGLVFPKA